MCTPEYLFLCVSLCTPGSVFVCILCERRSPSPTGCPQIIHRDIKPGNLLLRKDGTLKVADFGVSYMYDGEDDTVQSSAGTAAFLAPEICSGKGASGKVAPPFPPRVRA